MSSKKDLVKNLTKEITRIGTAFLEFQRDKSPGDLYDYYEHFLWIQGNYQYSEEEHTGYQNLNFASKNFDYLMLKKAWIVLNEPIESNEDIANRINFLTVLCAALQIFIRKVCSDNRYKDNHIFNLKFSGIYLELNCPEIYDQLTMQELRLNDLKMKMSKRYGLARKTRYFKGNSQEKMQVDLLKVWKEKEEEEPEVRRPPPPPPMVKLPKGERSVNAEKERIQREVNDKNEWRCVNPYVWKDNKIVVPTGKTRSQAMNESCATSGKIKKNYSGEYIGYDFRTGKENCVRGCSRGQRAN